jgi:hypothetical protein
MRKPLHQYDSELCDGSEKQETADLRVGFSQLFFRLGLTEFTRLDFATYFDWPHPKQIGSREDEERARLPMN